MTLHRDARQTLVAWRPETVDQKSLRDRFVTHLDDHSDGVRRECRPAHLTAGALVLDSTGSHALLTLHAKARRWFHLGGHLEPGDPTLAAAALREATEESGIADLVLDPTPVQVDEHVVGFCGAPGPVHHLDVRFLATAPRGARYLVSEESLDVRWWPLDELPDHDPGLVELVLLAAARQAGVVVGR